VSMAGSDRKFALVVATALTALASLALIISNLAYLDLGGSYGSLGPAIDSVTMSVIYILLAIIICVIVYLLYFYAKSGRMRGKATGKSNSPGAMLIAIFIVIALIGIFSLSGGHLNPFMSSDSQQGGAQDGTGNNATGPAGSASSILPVVFIAVVILGIVVGSRFLRKRPLRESVAIEQYEQSQADHVIEQAMKELYAGEDTKAVIVRTYQQMCRLIGGSSLGAPYLTPHELAELAVKRWKWPEDPVLTLTELFEEAWYSEHQLDEAKKETAIHCLEQLQSSQVSKRSQTGGANMSPGTS